MTSAVTTAVGVPRSSPLARRAFSGAAAALFVLFMGNNLPSALYGLERGTPTAVVTAEVIGYFHRRRRRFRGVPAGRGISGAA